MSHWVALCSPLSDFSFQHFSFCPIVALGWLARPVTNHESRITSGFGWLCPAFRCWKLDVGCSMFGVHDKPFEYNSPPSPPWGWSGGALVPPWTCPISIDPPQTPVFDQSGLSRSLSCGSPAVQRFSALDVGCWTLDVRCSGPGYWRWVARGLVRALAGCGC